MRSETYRTSSGAGFTDADGTFAEISAATANLVSNVLANVSQLIDDVSTDSAAVGRQWQALYEIALEGAQMAKRAARATPRFARIVRDVIHVIGRYRMEDSLRESTEGFLGADVHRAMRERLHRDGAERLYRLCIELRGGVLKLGQFASSRMDLLPEAYVERLSRLQDRVPPIPADQIVDRVEAELGAPLVDLFAGFETECIAAASLAQVHVASLHDGARVAIKVLVPGIEDIVETDINALQVIAPLLRDLTPLADLETVFGEFARALRGELDYEQEVRNAEEFAACFAEDPDVIVPRVYASHCSARVIALEYIDGQRLTEYLDDCERRGEAGAVDRDRILGILLRSFCAQILVHGVFHADPHPGNFLVVPSLEGPRLAVLDFGNVQRYSPSRRRAYAQLGLAILSGNGEQMALLLGEMGFHSRSGDPRALNEFAELLLEAFREGVNPFDIDPRERIQRVMQLTRENPVAHIPADFVQLGRVFASLGGLLMRYRPRLQLFEVLMPCLLQAAQAAADATARGD